MVRNKQRRVSSQKLRYRGVIERGYEYAHFLLGVGVCIELDILQNVFPFEDVTAMGDSREYFFFRPTTCVVSCIRQA